MTLPASESFAAFASRSCGSVQTNRGQSLGWELKFSRWGCGRGKQCSGQQMEDACEQALGTPTLAISHQHPGML